MDTLPSEKAASDPQPDAETAAMADQAREDERIARERAFHNERFTEETRTHQEKYYMAIQHGRDRFAAMVADQAVGKDVLEYGCAKGARSLELAPGTASIKGIDISDVAIEQANAAAAARGLGNAEFFAMNAEAMDFADASFDLVFGAGIIHHLDLDKAYGEIARVLRPGGQAVFWEPLGHNPVINLYRQMTPAARTDDEHPLLMRDLDTARRYFASVDFEPYGLLTLGLVPIGGTAIGRWAFKPIAATDSVLFKLPFFAKQAWSALLVLRK